MSGLSSPCAITSVDLLDLVEAELDGNLALEDVHEHLELLLVGVDVDDLTVEVGERPGRDLDRLAELILDLRPRPRALGGAGFAWPPGIWSLISVRTFFAIRDP